MSDLSPNLAVAQWVSLPQEMRLKLVNLFELKRSSATHVNNGKLETDGYTYNDLQGITIDKMLSYLGADYDMVDREYFTLFKAVLKKAEEPIPEPVELSPYLQQEQLIEGWKIIIDGIKAQAEAKQLLVEFKKLITPYGIQSIQKGPDKSPSKRGPKTKKSN